MRRALDRPRIQVDLSERSEQVVALLAMNDEMHDSTGACITLHEGLRLHLYGWERSEHGTALPRLVSGIVERNAEPDWNPHVRWCCRLDEWEDVQR